MFKKVTLVCILFSFVASHCDKANFSIDDVKNGISQLFVISSPFDWRVPFRFSNQMACSGSAFFVKDKDGNEGYILTNYHVVNSNNFIQLQTPSCGKEKFIADVVGVYPEMDIAALKIREDDFKRLKSMVGDLHHLPLGNSDKVKRTDFVMALGYPLGHQHWKSTEGIVSGRERPDPNGRLLIQITTPINPGNSGGAAIDSNGRVVGIASSGFILMQNIGFIIPINDVKSVMYKLLEGSPGNVVVMRDLFWGISITPSSEEIDKLLGNHCDYGVYVSDVYQGSIFESVGLMREDKICKIDGNKVDRYGEMQIDGLEDRRSISDFLNTLACSEDKSVTVEILRNGSPLKINFKADTTKTLPVSWVIPEYSKPEWINIGGMTVMQLTVNHLQAFQDLPGKPLDKYIDVENRYKPRLILTNIFGGSAINNTPKCPYPGQIITEVNDIEVETLEEFYDAVKKSVDTGFLKIRFEDKQIAVLDIKKVVEEEQGLALRNYYQPSYLIEELRQSLEKK